jgi:hypothetical protein
MDGASGCRSLKESLGTINNIIHKISRLDQIFSLLSSATHHIGLEVSTNTVSSSGTRWFDVDINPSNPDVLFAVEMWH